MRMLWVQIPPVTLRMPKKEKKLRREGRFDDLSDARTAEYVARRFESIETDLADMLPDLQSLGRYDDLTTVGVCLQIVKRLKKRYRKRADGFVWQDDEQ